MALITLTSLPTELLNAIVSHSMPESFESLAMTCRKFYNLCTSSIKRHNELCKRFRDFTYLKYPNIGLLSVHNPPAVNLIQEIAHNPVIARYIGHADFTYDTWPPKARPVQILPDPDLGGPVVNLFAESPYLREAGLEWREYYTLIQKDLESPSRYSQHAAAFLLTLLPNVTSLKLPCLWQSCERADKLTRATVRRALYKPSPSSPLWNSHSLSQVTEFEPYSDSGPSGHGVNLADAAPFLALPKLRLFRARSCVAKGVSSIATALEGEKLPPGEALEAAHFVDSCLDDVAITDFLQRTPNLEELVYLHSTKGQDSQDWDICRFVTAIKRQAGSHLESLEIRVREFHGSFAPGKLSMRGFQSLRKLHLPLEVAGCNLATDSSFNNGELTAQDLGELQRLTDILVPASVSELSLHSAGTDRHEKALRAMFFDFAARKNDWVPALKDIRLSPEPIEDGAYKDECGRLKVEIEQTGVTLHLGEAPDEEKDWFDEEII
ncbi:hypothetical protein N0V93_008854 [Gnomoniopsis smithogilvyi]|uniref:F-box domain-containing protein n=1 Tax=Gnomoniopsis smithogilvyi TaxID=1191159 RepID=A0A9W9CT35_9PEZI|nr:hypothetical protein N0V93_008854 [Gnomoniopsis smithogilvyi]